MPDAPAPAARLSTTRTSSPPPSPLARSSRPRCQAVESPWLPAPMITYRLCVGTMDPPFRFPGPEAVDLDAKIVADRHDRVKQVPSRREGPAVGEIDHAHQLTKHPPGQPASRAATADAAARSIASRRAGTG